MNDSGSSNWISFRPKSPGAEPYYKFLGAYESVENGSKVPGARDGLELSFIGWEADRPASSQNWDDLIRPQPNPNAVIFDKDRPFIKLNDFSVVGIPTTKHLKFSDDYFSTCIVNVYPNLSVYVLKPKSKHDYGFFDRVLKELATPYRVRNWAKEPNFKCKAGQVLSVGYDGWVLTIIENQIRDQGFDASKVSKWDIFIEWLGKVRELAQDPRNFNRATVIFGWLRDDYTYERPSALYGAIPVGNESRLVYHGVDPDTRKPKSLYWLTNWRADFCPNPKFAYGYEAKSKWKAYRILKSRGDWAEFVSEASTAYPAGSRVRPRLKAGKVVDTRTTKELAEEALYGESKKRVKRVDGQIPPPYSPHTTKDHNVSDNVNQSNSLHSRRTFVPGLSHSGLSHSRGQFPPISSPPIASSVADLTGESDAVSIDFDDLCGSLSEFVSVFDLTGEFEQAKVTLSDKLSIDFAEVEAGADAEAEAERARLGYSSGGSVSKPTHCCFSEINSDYSRASIEEFCDALVAEGEFGSKRERPWVSLLKWKGGRKSVNFEYASGLMFDFDKATVPLNEAKAAFRSTIKAWGESRSYIDRIIEFRRTFWGVVIQPSASYDEAKADAAGVYKYHMFLLLREPHGLEETRAGFWGMAQQYQNPDQRYVNKGFMGFWKEWGRLLGSDCRIRKAFGEMDKDIFDLARVFFCSPWEPEHLRVSESVYASASEVEESVNCMEEEETIQYNPKLGTLQVECYPGLSDDCTVGTRMEEEEAIRVKKEKAVSKLSWEERMTERMLERAEACLYDRYG